MAIHEEAPGSVAIGRTLTPLDDGFGNIIALVDQSGKRVATYEYGPFGEWIGGHGELSACPFRWQSKWFDAESEHYYFGYRYYSPQYGRWLSRDPLREAGGFNLYAYCGNDPVNRHDPLGLASPPFTPDVFDQDNGVGYINYQNTDYTFLLTQIAKAAQLNTWLDAQAVEIAAVQGELATAQADATVLRNLSLRLPGGMASFMSPFGSIGGDRGMAQQVYAARLSLGAQIGQLEGRLGTLLDEAQPWFDASGNLYGDLDGNGRIAGRDELSRPFQNRVVNVGMHDQTFDALNAIGFVQAGMQIPRALGALTTSAAGRVMPRLVAEGGGNSFTRFFYDPRRFSQVSAEYWAARGAANGRSLHHTFFPQRMTQIPEGIRNAGFNLLEVPAMRGVFHPRLDLNRWMGFARNWGPQARFQAGLMENAIRYGVPAAGAGTGYLSYKAGGLIYQSSWGDE
jgi:RHS repeat-associated protein